MMKRLRSYGEDLDDAAGKEWERREMDSDRSSSRRRFYPQSGSLRRSSSSLYDRPVDGDEETLRPPRRRFEHEVDGFDRRKMFDRYRDGGGGGGGGGVDRAMHVSLPSPRGSYGGDRMHRSESFSGLRREFPKGFRSDRDRSRREGGCGGSSWRRFSFGKVGAGEERRSPALDLEDRGRARSRDSSSGEQSKQVEAVKVEKEKAHKKQTCSSSEMEEGELEPDPEPEPSVDATSQADMDSQNCRYEDGGYKSVCDGSSENKDVSLSVKKSDSVSGTYRSVEMQVFQVTSNVAVRDGRNQPNEIVMRLDGETRGKGEGFVDRGGERESLAERRGEGEDLAEDNVKEEKLEGTSGSENKEKTSHESSYLPSQEPVLKMKCQVEEDVVKDDEPINVYAAPLGGNLEYKLSEGHGREVEVDAEKKEVVGINIEYLQNEEKGLDQFDQVADQRQGKGIEILAAFGSADGGFSSVKEATAESNLAPTPMKNEIKENPKDKGKSIAFSLSNNAGSAEDGDDVEGPSRRGFELIFRDYVAQPEKISSCGLYAGRIKDEILELEPLDLSLGLPGILPDQDYKLPNAFPSSPCHTKSIQSLPSSFRTISDGFTPSVSFSGSQPFVHNPSCSLTQNSLDNFEQSVVSRPIFQGLDQVSSGTVWQGLKSNDPKGPKKKAGASALFHKAILNGNHSQASLQGLNAHHHLNSLLQPSLPRQVSPTLSVGSHDTWSEHSNDKRILTRERSFNSLSRSEQQREGEQAVNVPSVVERIITRIVSEPLQVVERMLQDMTQHSIAYLKDSISRMLAETDKQRQIHALQGALRRKSDLTSEIMTKCPRTLLEILVALKTGLPDFIQRPNNASLSDLVEIYQNLKCRNLACRTVLPVDDCDCKICSQKNGFCSACMCLICSKFDLASNTCSWVGCDVCLHWCHTDCGLRDSHIRNGRSSSVAPGATEMQFHCVACGHPSEMFGFVKEVFKTCSKGWKAENLAKELQYVRRIFSSSNDVRGKSLYQAAGQMLVKLEDKKKHPEVVKYIMTFFSESESTIRDGPPLYSLREPSGNIDQRSNAVAFPSAETAWLPPVSVGKVPCIQHASAASGMDVAQMCRPRKDAVVQTNFEKKPVVDELESVVGFKQTEAQMYQERADNARREAEGLKRIAIAKSEKIEDEYSSKMAKLQLHEAEERRRQKLEELQAIERAHHDFMKMKARMEAEIKDLLMKMEVARRNFNA